MFKMFVGKNDYQIDSAYNACELISQFQAKQSYDVIFLDWEMPEINGLEALHFLKRSGCQIPIIMLTGKNSESNIDQAFKAGAKNYLMKPFTEDLIQGALEDLRS